MKTWQKRIVIPVNILCGILSAFFLYEFFFLFIMLPVPIRQLLCNYDPPRTVFVETREGPEGQTYVDSEFQIEKKYWWDRSAEVLFVDKETKQEYSFSVPFIGPTFSEEDVIYEEEEDGTHRIQIKDLKQSPGEYQTAEIVFSPDYSEILSIIGCSLNP